MSGFGDIGGGESDRHGAFLPRSERHRALTGLLRAHVVLSSRVIAGLGFSQREITGLVSRGELVRVHRGVYVDGRSRLTPWGHLQAALLAAGPSAFLSHRTAAAARKYRSINTRAIHVSVVASGTPRIPGLILHRTLEPFAGEVTRTGGLRAASLPRILVELAATASEDELRELITQGERHNALDDIAATLDRHSRRPGIRRLRHLLQHHRSSPAGNSGYEERFWAWYLAEPDLPPPDEINIHLGPFEFDGIWLRERLVLELDSREYHQAKQDMEKDRLKDIYVQKLGYRIVRITTTRFDFDKPGIRADLLAFLRFRRAA